MMVRLVITISTCERRALPSPFPGKRHLDPKHPPSLNLVTTILYARPENWTACRKGTLQLSWRRESARKHVILTASRQSSTDCVFYEN
jgi:hypothetical protein